MNVKEKFTHPKARAATLSSTRNLKMSRSSHGYVRGNTVKFYEWLEAQKNGALPEGPPVWICGDCHVGNLGPVANSAGRIEIQIRDLDQTVIGNPAHGSRSPGTIPGFGSARFLWICRGSRRPTCSNK